MRKIINKFNEHPASVGETYFEHLHFVVKGALHLVKISGAMLIHGLMPFFFTTYARDRIVQLEQKLLKRNPLKGNRISNSILDLIGNTPLLHLTRFNPGHNSNIFAKCEMFNPTLSIKDRIVLFMLRQYEQNGTLKPGGTIYEMSSSGNAGSSVAMIAAVLGYKAVIIVPPKTNQEKIDIMKAYGAEVIVCQDDTDIPSEGHYTNMAHFLSDQDPGSVYFNQSGSENNVLAHSLYTAEEIWQQMNGKIDYLVATESSSGTITGIGRFLKQKNPNIKIILADPVGSVFYDYFHSNELIAENYQDSDEKDKICSIHDFSVIDEVIKFTDEEAYDTAKKLAGTEGLLADGSSGGALFVAEKVVKSIQSNDVPNLVVMLPDSGFKYLSKSYRV